MDRQQASVLHYGNQELNAEDIRGGQQHSRPSTASSASSVESDSTDNDGRSSLAGEADMESPLTSPASLRRPAYATSRDDGDDDDDDSGSEISVREATPDLAHQASPDLSRSTLAGYELLANKLSEGSKDMQHSSVEENVVPMYRKFEHLNHRVLLHIQDEIAELEDELRYLDECVAQYSPRNGAGRHHPASRRSEMRYGSELHGRRTELLGRIYLKLGQYNTALSSFSNMLRDMAPAELEDIDGYKTWMENHTPIDHVESRFLERKDDLLRISRRRSASIAGGAASHQPATIWLPMILVLPLMAFAIVPGLLGRLFILCVTGAATMRMFTSTEELQELMTMREWTACLSV
ncbi:hypothetical protein CC80DRAFT_429439 [Byssothecium circinans]|uniref:DUF6594 domain-containing protein n=1 Tax=Byssothecium circinans TaxID=147558 RepID=A0A6A5T8M0_9PLEO|nr:hypothetical protein CC80DRAFT_429439 [Byssothecium circinans]